MVKNTKVAKNKPAKLGNKLNKVNKVKRNYDNVKVT